MKTYDPGHAGMFIIRSGNGSFVKTNDYAALHALAVQQNEALTMMVAQGSPLGSYGDAAFAKANEALAAAEELLK